MPEIPEFKCNKCGHTWTPTKEEPKCCPRCKSYDWNKPAGEKK